LDERKSSGYGCQANAFGMGIFDKANVKHLFCIYMFLKNLENYYQEVDVQAEMAKSICYFTYQSIRRNSCGKSVLSILMIKTFFEFGFFKTLHYFQIAYEGIDEKFSSNINHFL
jgi:hypothetical protein